MEITNYSELFNNVFSNMVPVKLPDYWYEDAYQVVTENWAKEIENDFKEEERNIGFDEFEAEWATDFLNEYYVSYVVNSNYDLDKLQKYHVPVFWVEDLDAYVFIQGWFGMASYLIKTDIIDTADLY